MIACAAVCSAGAVSSATAAALSLPQKLAILAASYPGAIASSHGSELVMRDGTRIQIDDARAKSHPQKLAVSDIEDMLSQIYPLARCRTEAPPRQRNFDPGRIRNDAFFRALYGRTRADVQRHLTSIDWFGGRMRVTTRFGVAEKLTKIRNELRRLGPAYQRYLRDSAGAFNWRTIAGTSLLSTHSFGIAVDINIKNAAYWRWAGGKPGNVRWRANRIPMAIVEIFERHGFIWGGQWYHYDTMHFEYRPELIAIARKVAPRSCAN